MSLPAATPCRKTLAVIFAIALAALGMHGARADYGIRIDVRSAGRTFDGVGAISGGGGTSRLLVDYPEQQRSEILDYLFKPHFGAALQILKVEIGADANSTNGAEASHMRSRSDHDYDRGYEWWLMEQAKARNPAIKLSALEWAAPGWLNDGMGAPDAFFSQDNVDYLIDWIEHAQSDHGLHIDYIGGWNEANVIAPYDENIAWYAALKDALRGHGLTTQLVAFDATGENWEIAKDLQTSAALRSAVDIIGVHYPCGDDGGPALKCDYVKGAVDSGKPIWASEHGSQNWDDGAPALARALNRDYIDGRMTALINWSAAGSWYSTLPDSGDALMQADEPWSGHYYVAKSIWVMAHTGQFTAPGWRYLDDACGYVGGDRKNGSYVTLASPDGADYSVIAETTTATKPRTITFHPTGTWSAREVHIWSTDLGSKRSDDWFVHAADVTPRGDAFTVTLQPDHLYSISTTAGQRKGDAQPPATAIQSLPYREDFESYKPGSLIRYFAAAQGAFEAEPCAANRAGTCMQQQITQAPIAWPIGSSTGPLVVVGDPRWTDYAVTVAVLLGRAGYVDLIGRFGGLDQFDFSGSQGYHLRVFADGRWGLLREQLTGANAVLASGRVVLDPNAWHTLSLGMHGATIQSSIDAGSVTTVTDGAFHSGDVGLLVSGWQQAQFDDFSVRP